MSWVVVAWAMMASASLTLALVHLMTWLKVRTQAAHLLFSIAAASVTAVAAFEVLMMRSGSAAEFVALHRAFHVPIFVLIVSMVAFIRVYLGSGRHWLAWTIVVMRLVILVVNFLGDTSVSYAEVVTLRQIPFPGGEQVSIIDGVASVWNRVEAISLVLLFVYVVDAALRAARNDDRTRRRRALVVGSSVALTIVVAGTHAMLVQEGLVASPYMVTPAFLMIVAAMGLQLGSDVIRAAKLSEQLRISEAGARTSEERLRLALKGARLALWDWDIAAGRIHLGEHWARILVGEGRPAAITPAALRERVHPGDLDAFDRHIRQALDGELLEYDVDYRVRRDSGNWAWIRSQGEVVARDPQGRALRMAGSSEDITARKFSEEQFRLVFEASPAGIIMVDTDGRIMLVNTQTEALFGYTRDQLLGQPVEILIPGRHLAAHAGLRRRWFDAPLVLEKGGRRDLHGLRSDGTEVLLEIGVTPVHAPEGLRALASITDVTERRQMELQSARQRNELAHLSRVTMLGELSGSLAHELNQPLAAILSNAQAAQRFLAQGTGQLDEVRDILRDIVEDDRRAGEVIRRLRAMLRKEDIQYSRLDLNEVAVDTLRLVQSDFLNRGVTVDTDLATGLHSVEGDRIQLQQVLLNLAINACDAMSEAPDGLRRLTLRTAPGRGDEVEISVRDTGTGIAVADIEHVFEPFVTTKAHGMGLGLAVCRTIVDAHGGRIWAEQGADRGTVFRIRLPAARSTAA